MLCYAFQVLKQSNYENIAAEEFDEVQDLFAAILSKGVSKQLKQGLHREYVTQRESLYVMRGKLDISQTIQNRIQRKQQLACEYDELSENNQFNQILKTTMHYLIRDKNVSGVHRLALRKILVFFDGVDLVNPTTVSWGRICYNRNNKNYEMLLNICYFVMDGMLQTTENGEYKMATFSDEHMARLYEKFILEYYRRHHTYLSEVKAAEVDWNLQGENKESARRFLPIMKTDVFLRYGEKNLILDAKYYGKVLQKQFDKYTLHSGDLYQIFSYVKNQDRENTGNVSGVLVYAKTDEEISFDECMFNVSGNQIGARTLNLNQDFKSIAAQLDSIAEYFLEGWINNGNG